MRCRRSTFRGRFQSVGWLFLRAYWIPRVLRIQEGVTRSTGWDGYGQAPHPPRSLTEEELDFVQSTLARVLAEARRGCGAAARKRRPRCQLAASLGDRSWQSNCIYASFVAIVLSRLGVIRCLSPSSASSFHSSTTDKRGCDAMRCDAMRCTQ